MGKVSTAFGALGAAAILSASPLEKADGAESANPALANVPISQIREDMTLYLQQMQDENGDGVLEPTVVLDAEGGVTEFDFKGCKVEGDKDPKTCMMERREYIALTSQVFDARIAKAEAGIAATLEERKEAEAGIAEADERIAATLEEREKAKKRIAATLEERKEAKERIAAADKRIAAAQRRTAAAEAGIIKAKARQTAAERSFMRKVGS